MEPRIQYATTTDGVSIAFSTIGEGPTLVMPPPALPWSHLELEWQIPDWRHFYEHLAERYRVVRYDSRGAGLSDKQVTDVSLEALIRDLDAVVDRLAIDRMALFGTFYTAPLAIAYAARHPERVSHLVTWCGFSRLEDDQRPAAVREALERLIDLDYELFTETLAHTVFGWSEGEAAHRIAGYMQQSLSPDRARLCWASNDGFDVDDLLPDVKAPALILHRRDFAFVPQSVARRLASRIADARLMMFDGASLAPYSGEIDPLLKALDEFLGVAEASPAQGKRPHPHAGRSGSAVTAGFRTIMFTDMEGSTAFTQRLGDDGAQQFVRLHNAIVTNALEGHGGSQVKHTGDGIMASFLTASSAVECGVAIQREFAAHNEANPDERVNVRIGVNAGEPVMEGDDLFGTAVQLASRICARAEAGTILASDVVRQLVAGKGFLFADHGEAELRGFEDPVRLFEVRWRTEG
jgi:class 3 adenylate cyclase/pimeloyl-ACP methyl ester carboxylesterase